MIGTGELYPKGGDKRVERRDGVGTSSNRERNQSVVSQNLKGEKIARVDGRERASDESQPVTRLALEQRDIEHAKLPRTALRSLKSYGPAIARSSLVFHSGAVFHAVHI